LLLTSKKTKFFFFQAATLSNILELQHLAGKILSMIATNVCQTSGFKLPTSSTLSIELVLTGGLELASWSEDCWLPVFSVCRHVTQLEHDLFSISSSNVTGNNVTGNKNDDSPSKDKNNPANYFIDEDETW
jgi:brefeldin A-inhibited guanine nucleotide-exchange protein 3